jgi:hypothetical protein
LSRALHPFGDLHTLQVKHLRRDATITRRLVLLLALTLPSIAPGQSRAPPAGKSAPTTANRATQTGKAAPQAKKATPAPQRSAERGVAGAVQAEMRHVDFHIDEGIILRINRLRGQLVPSKPAGVPTLDDKSSFSLTIGSALIAIDMKSLSTLLNRHVFGYKGSPLKKLEVTTDGDQLMQTGVMHKGVDLPFRIRAALSLTPAGEIRLHPTSVRVVGVGVQRLMRFFGAELDGLIKIEKGHGVRIEGNDFILDATAILPPPRIQGRLTGIRVEEGRIVQTFGPDPSLRNDTLVRPNSAEPNYMYFRGGTLRFGKLTMRDTDMKVVDKNMKDPFDFSIDRYNDQLVAGYSKNTPTLGLIVHMPDFATVTRGARATASGRPPSNPKGEK